MVYVERVGEIVLGLVGLLNRPSVSIYWGYLLTALVLAAAVYVRRRRRRATARGLFRYLFPRCILFRPSVRHDLVLLVLNTLLQTFALGVPLQTISSTVASATWELLRAGLGPLQAPLSGVGLGIVATVAIFIAADFGFYVAHRLLHRVRFLWELHKVHHSAPVLTPLTVFRRHPFDIAFEGAVSGIVLGTAYGGLGWLGGLSVSSYAILGVNALLFVGLAIGFNLQHSHVWLRFGPLERVLISPAAHQLHHSDDPAHFDRNFGNILSIWDRLFGTHVAPPRERPKLSFGLGRDTATYGTVARLYGVPLLRVFRREQLDRHRGPGKT